MYDQLLEWAVFIVQTLVISVGYPGQIYKNYTDNTNGEHSFKLYALTVMFVLRTFQNIHIDAWYYYIPDALGIILMIVTISQLWKPRNPFANIVSKYFNLFPRWMKGKEKKVQGLAI